MSNFDFAFKCIADSPEKEQIIQRQTTLPKQINEILNILKKDEKALIFLNKVSKKDAPNYYDLITEPMDLGTVSKKIQIYRSLDHFKKDLDLIWDNCLKYNTAENFIRCANEMRIIADSLIKKRSRVLPEMIDNLPDMQIPPRNYHKSIQRIIEKNIAKCLQLVGFEKSEKSAIKMISDILEHRIMKEILKRKDL